MLPNCVILSDSMNHNSMIAGVKYARCEKVIFEHNDVSDLEAKIRQIGKDRPIIIAFESVYSMDGDIAPIRDIVQIAEDYNALTFIDEDSYIVSSIWELHTPSEGTIVTVLSYKICVSKLEVA